MFQFSSSSLILYTAEQNFKTSNEMIKLRPYRRSNSTIILLYICSIRERKLFLVNIRYIFDI